ncbi:MAG: hypothetical protein OFPII_21980 [Osedax symbiont Rs1]|nr:MAG: hypothetical protein OFPII_21980 [Osedax symbiont Rs1]
MLLKLKWITLALCTLLAFSCTLTFGCVLKMGYKDGEKRPLIGDENTNSGVYFEMYTLAAKQIGCELVVYRSSKKRVLQRLQQGFLDFYPGAAFSLQRASYMQYIKNGLMTAEYGLTPLNYPDIQSYSRIKSLGLIWLQELGSAKQEISDRLWVKTQQTTNVTIDKVMRYFETRGVNFYVVDKARIDQFTFRRPDYFLEYNGLQLHKNCCGGIQPMYLAFSKKSAHLQLQDNPNFDSATAVSLSNQRQDINKTSIAYDFSQALAKLAREGVTEKLYQKYLLMPDAN